MQPDFNAAFAATLGHEGGFTADPNDSGNWTGGAVGVGVLKGTKWGISAASYPQLDIKNLTIADAKAIYLRDWWNANGYQRFASHDVAAKVFDMAVNMGAGMAHTLLQLAARVFTPGLEIDGKIGRDTVAAANKPPAADLLNAIRSAAATYYWDLKRHNPAKARYLAGWLSRAYALNVDDGAQEMMA